MKRIPLFLLALFCNAFAYAQFADKNYYLVDSLTIKDLTRSDQVKLDSLLKIYHASKNDSVRIEALTGLTNLDDFNTWIKYNKIFVSEVSRLLKSNNKKNVSERFLNQKLGNGYYNMNYYYSMINTEDSAFKYLRLCIEPARKGGRASDLADAYTALGVYYGRNGNTKESIKQYHEALTIYENANNKKGIERALTSIGIEYRNIDEFAKALDYCKRALKIREETNDRESLPDVWNQIGIIYKWSKDTANAIRSYQKSLECARQINDDYSIAAAMLNLGIIEQDHKRYDNAIKNYEESLERFKKIKSTNGIAYALNSLAITYDLKGESKKALSYARQGFDLSIKLGYPEGIMNSRDILGNIYESLGMYKEAFENEKYFYQLKDSLMNADKQKEALKTQLEFENQKKLLEVKKEQESKDLVAKQEKKQHLIIISFVVLCLLIVVVFTGFLFNRFRLIKKQKNIIEAQNHLVTEKNREILDSISYAKRLQEAILPPMAEVNKFLPESFLLYRPKDIVAGDFYWMHVVETTTGTTTLFAVADSTGHGVPGALVSVVCSNALNRSVNEFGLSDPGKILDKTRELVLETFEKSEKDVKDGMDISLVAIHSSPSGAHINWAGANNPLWYISNNTLHEIKGDKQPVGKTEHQRPFTTHTIDLQQGDLIYLFTDGYADQFGGEKGKKYKYKALSDFLVRHSKLEMTQQQKMLNEEFISWLGNLEQVDDVCIAGIRIG
jgi:tetratricopeptide (TPR) repeat protein